MFHYNIIFSNYLTSNLTESVLIYYTVIVQSFFSFFFLCENITALVSNADVVDNKYHLQL